jgi:2-dehydro-3-deoxygluconokinase
MRPDTLPLEVIRSARLLHVSGISQAISGSACDAVFAAIDVAAGAGALVTYDPNLRLKLWPLPRARATILATVARCDWCLPSMDDARVLFDGADPAAVVDACHRAGAPGVVVKLGAEGCMVSDGKRREHVAAHRVTPLDATGAGDCFDGAFAARLLAGDDPFAAARYANVAAALATTGFGAVAPLPRDADVRAILAKAGA